MISLNKKRETLDLRTKDGGFGLYPLKDRYHIVKIANMGHLLRSYIGGMMRRFITQIALDRYVHKINDILKFQIVDFSHG
jgi:hypothetical protein